MQGFCIQSQALAIDWRLLFFLHRKNVKPVHAPVCTRTFLTCLHFLQRVRIHLNSTWLFVSWNCFALLNVRWTWYVMHKTIFLIRYNTITARLQYKKEDMYIAPVTNLWAGVTTTHTDASFTSETSPSSLWRHCRGRDLFSTLSHSHLWERLIYHHSWAEALHL